MTKTGIIWDERYMGHLKGVEHPECPERLAAIKEVLDQDSGLVWCAPRLATEEEVARVHAVGHVRQVGRVRDTQGYFDMDTPYTPASSDAAFLAAGGVIELAHKVDSGELNNGFAFPRPPGHHAENDRAMGFCLFNNIAIAAEFLIQQQGKQRVAIVDIDVHHGNGTQHSFYERSDVFFFSLHRFPFYPGTGAASETGRGEGEGYTLNIEQDPMADDDDYYRSFEDQLVPALTNYQPDFILVSAGFDAHQRDPLGGMNITQKGFRMMSQKLNAVANKVCQGKIVYVLEGGYDMLGLQEGVEAVLSEIK